MAKDQTGIICYCMARSEWNGFNTQQCQSVGNGVVLGMTVAFVRSFKQTLLPWYLMEQFL